MATFVSTIKFTEQGIKAIGETTKRAAAVKAAAKKMKVKVTDIYWTLGPFDGLLVFDAPDDETATAMLLHSGRWETSRRPLPGPSPPPRWTKSWRRWADERQRPRNNERRAFCSQPLSVLDGLRAGEVFLGGVQVPGSSAGALIRKSFDLS